MGDSFDFVIIGAGSAGSVLASRLSEDETVTVCVLEAGPPDRNPYIHIPAGFIKTLVNPTVNWLFQIESSEWTAGRAIAAPQGKTLGGSSSINGHVYNRGQRMDFDAWAQLGNHSWGYADVLPYFKRSERRIGDGDDTFHGRDGGLPVTDLDWRHPICEAFVAGAIGMGIPRNPDYNGAEQAGVGYYQRAINRGRRVSAARAFLHPAMSRPNLDVRPRAQATAIRFNGRRAMGVCYRVGGAGGVEREVHVRREVILSGGALNSPKLLQLSGIGPGPLLRDLGIPVVHELAGAGENLRDHYAARMVARVKGIATINQLARGARLVGEIAKWTFGRPSVLALQPSLVHVFWKSDAALDAPDLQFVFTPASYKEGSVGLLDDFAGMTCGVWQQRPSSTGYVHTRSADPFDKPIIQPNYLTEEADRQVLLGGLKLARRLLSTPELGPYFDRHELPAPDQTSDQDLLDFARERGSTAFHFMGSCRMGPSSDPTAVVDDALKVRGIDGLRIADASIMPTMPSGNTYASTLMIAEKAADMIRDRPPLAPVALAGA